MIDIHNHILYDCDDGARTIEKSVEIVKKAVDSGVTDIILTPHYMEDGYKNDSGELNEKLQKLKQTLKEQGVDVNLYLGEEVFISPDIFQNLEHIIPLNNSHYVLMELPLVEHISYADEVIFELVANGYTPIIAHPERYSFTEKGLDELKGFIEKGALLQINVNSLAGRYGSHAKKVAKKLIIENMVHFVASDAHSENGYQILNESLSILKKLVDEETYNDLTYNNPKCVIDDIKIKNKEKSQTKSFLKRFLIKSFSILGVLLLVCTSMSLAYTKEDVISAIQKTYTVGNETFRLPQPIIDKGINYLNKNPLSTEQYNKIMSSISNAVALANEVGTTDITKVSDEDLDRALLILSSAANSAGVDLQKEMAENSAVINGAVGVKENKEEIKKNKEEEKVKPNKTNVDSSAKPVEKVEETANVSNINEEKSQTDIEPIEEITSPVEKEDGENPLLADDTEISVNDLQFLKEIKRKTEKSKKIYNYALGIIIAIFLFQLLILYLIVKMKKYKMVKWILLILVSLIAANALISIILAIIYYKKVIFAINLYYIMK